MGFIWRKAKHEPSPTPKEKTTRLRWAEEKQPWTEDGWKKVIFRDESPICVGQGDLAGTLVWSNETERCLAEEHKHISTVIDDMGKMSGKEAG